MDRDKELEQHPVPTVWIRVSGMLILVLMVAGAYFKADHGNLTAALMYVAFVAFLAPPVLIGRLPGLLTLLSKMGLGNLNESPLDPPPGIDRWGFILIFTISFCVSAATVMYLTK